jgi:hypothetical protein
MPHHAHFSHLPRCSPCLFFSISTFFLRSSVRTHTHTHLCKCMLSESCRSAGRLDSTTVILKKCLHERLRCRIALRNRPSSVVRIFFIFVVRNCTWRPPCPTAQVNVLVNSEAPRERPAEASNEGSRYHTSPSSKVCIVGFCAPAVVCRASLALPSRAAN